MKLLTIILAALLDIVPGGDAVLEQIQKRDSILIADQMRYSVTVSGMDKESGIFLPDLSKASNDTLTILGGWQLDTLSRGRAVRSRNAKAADKILRKPFDLRASIILVPFEEGRYQLPDIPVVRSRADRADTLLFKGIEMEVKTMPVDTATFQLHDIKGQIQYPVTFKEMLPWIGAGLLLAALVAALIWWLRRRSRAKEAEKVREPAHITALRNLDRYRGEKFWAPDKQKGFYSGVTDTLKTYIEARFGVDAPEMTTAELFGALKSEKDITPELYTDAKELFEIADFVKFAKHSAPDDYNAKVVPVAVRFVTETYQTTLEEEPKEDVL